MQMRSPVVLGAFAALLVVQVGAFRVRQKKKTQKATPAADGQVDAKDGADGQVDYLFTWGAASSGKPPIKNAQRGDGCFPGTRFWAANHDGALFGVADEVDLVAQLANVVGYRHPYMDSIEIEHGEGENHAYPCSEERTRGPYGLPSLSLHSRSGYIDRTSKIDDQLIRNVSRIGLEVSYEQDEQKAARHVSSFGWGLVHTAFHPGSIAVGGPQISHLIQDPDSLTCMVTFQGTDSFQDLMQDLNAFSVDFCGLEGQVHKGFRNHLRRIVQSDVFQDRILPYLPGCSKVISIGHSLGGSMAELFAACIQRAPAKGTAGWKSDYQHFSWKKTQARRLPYV